MLTEPGIPNANPTPSPSHSVSPTGLDLDPPTSDAVPIMPSPPATPAGPADEAWQRLRRFLAQAPEAADLATPGTSYLPALLARFRGGTPIRHDYPLYLPPPDDDAAATSLVEMLRVFAEDLDAAAEATRLLKDTIPRLEREVAAQLDGTPLAARPAFADAARAVETSLSLRGDVADAFHACLQTFLASLADDGRFVKLDEQTPLHLFLHIARPRAAAGRAALDHDLDTLSRQLRDRLRADDAKHPSTDGSNALRDTIGAGGDQHVDPAALARILGAPRGTTSMEPRRRRAIEGVLATFDRFRTSLRGPLVHVVHGEELSSADNDDAIEWHAARAGDICRTTAVVFDETARRFEPLFAAMRIARLELAGMYDPDRHDRLAERFGWRSFDRDELWRLPPVLAIAPAGPLFGPGIVHLSHLLLSGRPVNIAVMVQPAANPGVGTPDDPVAGYRFELGYFGVSHREAFVSQSSAAKPRHLLEGYRQGLAANRAALHVIAQGVASSGDVPPLDRWLHGGTAVEGRAHPIFLYNPEAGATWARRLDVRANPQLDMDWPTHELPCQTTDGASAPLTIPVTFADFALLDHAYCRDFHVIPPEIVGDDLLPIADYLARPPDDVRDRVPFVWAVNGSNHLHRLAVSDRLAFACRDRLDYWHTLQELAGIRNEHVQEAIAQERDRLERAFDDERSRIEAAHGVALDAARAEAAEQAMRRLAERLLGRDVSAIASAARSDAPAAAMTSPAVTAPPAPTPATDLEPPAAVETPAASVPTAAAPAPPLPEAAAAASAEEEDDEPAEPWIDSALCTSCNDCLDINPRLFVYNANKQAAIGDASAGTFEEIVRAAEKCPARCIHPGQPLDSSEPNLETLIERAAPFQ